MQVPVKNLCETLVGFYNVHKKTFQNQTQLFNAPKHQSFIPLSTKVNHYKTKQHTGDAYIDLLLKRPIDNNIGNRFVQLNYPGWLSHKQSLSKSTYINSLLHFLGFNEPEYYDPPDSPNVIEVTEEDNEQEKLLKLREENVGNPDSYQLAGFVVDEDDEEEVPEVV